MYLKSQEKYLILGGLVTLIVTLVFCPVFQAPNNNQTMLYTVVGLKFQDGGVFAALIVGIWTVLATVYNSNKNYKAMKLSLIPTKSANLLIDLEHIFNEYEIYSHEFEEDSIILLIQILNFWSEHQKVFRVLTPNFYNNLMKLWNKLKLTEENDDIPEKNSKYVFNMIIQQFSEVPSDKNKKAFLFMNPNLISDYIIFGNNKEDLTEYKLDKEGLYNFINDISGSKTRNLTNNLVDDFYCDLKNTLSDLKREIEEYD